MEKSMAIISFVRLSGATVQRDSDGVYVKYSDNPNQWEFLNQQAMYMADCGPPFVEILGIAHGRYWMREYGIAFNLDLEEAIRQAKDSLAALWCTSEPRYIDRNWIGAHRRRVTELCEMNGVMNFRGRLSDMFEQNVVENESRLTVCKATHGDATLSNTVFHSDGTMRWIDPIPPSLWLPAFKAVDLGKLMQSSHGWEFVMNNANPPPYCDNEVLHDESVIDMLAAGYFHILCYLRILRYAEKGSLPHNYAMNRLHEFLG